MAIELPREIHQEAVKSIERHFLEHMDEKIGNIAAGGRRAISLHNCVPAAVVRANTT